MNPFKATAEKNSAAQPADSRLPAQAAIPTTSAGRFGPNLQETSFQKLGECQEWLASLPMQLTKTHAPLQRLLVAVECLQAAPSRQRREQMRKLLGEWNVPQKCNGSKRKLSDVNSALETNVLQEAYRLKKIRIRAEITGNASSAISPFARPSASAEQPAPNRYPAQEGEESM